MNIRRKLIRDLVVKLLTENHCHTAPVDIQTMAERHNIVVYRHYVEEEVSGFLYRKPRGEAAIIGVNNNQSANRQRFTIAHELGHYLLHSGDGVHVDEDFKIKRRDSRSSEGVDLEEIEANLFAAEILIPEHLLAQDLDEHFGFDLHDEECVTSLAKKYRVSQQAMAIRLSYLGYLTM